MYEVILIFILLLTMLSPAVAQSQSDFSSSYGNTDKSMNVIIFILVCSFFFIGFFSIYVRYCSEHALPSSAAAVVDDWSLKPARGLDPWVIESFPVFQYSAVKDLKIVKGALECAVCINEFDHDDELRLLPNCDHVFHLECINTWLISHVTCPVCRSNLKPESSAADEKIQIAEPVELESNTSGTQNQIYNQNSNQVSINIKDAIRQAGDFQTENQKKNRLGVMIGKFSRSHSTGHSLRQPTDNSERHRLILPEDVRKQILTLKRSNGSVVIFPREESSRRGCRGSGEESSRGKIFQDRFFGWSDRWIFTMAPPFVGRTVSFHSPKVAGSIITSSDRRKE